MNHDVSHVSQLSPASVVSYAQCPHCASTEVSVLPRTPSVLALHCGACRESWTIPERRLNTRVAVTAMVHILGGV